MIRLTKITRISKKKNWFVGSVQQLVLVVGRRIVRHMVLTSSSSNASSAAASPNGSVGETLISASRVIKSSAQETMCLGRNRVNCHSVLERINARLRLIILKMVKNML